MTITSNKITEHKKLICLDLGAGHNPVSLLSHLVISVDSRKEMNPVVCCDLRKLPFDDNSVDAIHTSHVLEHFAYIEIIPILTEWVRVLKIGGDFWIRVPDITFACRKVLANDYDWSAFATFYGEQTYDLNFHKMGFTQDILKKFIEQIPNLEGHIGTQECLCLDGSKKVIGIDVIYEGVKINN